MHAPPELAVRVDKLVKQFGKTSALQGIDLTVETGSIVGLLGPNGAGKTTTVRILATLVRPDAGSASIFGYDVVRHARDVRRLVGLAGQYAGVDENISGLENLYLVARLVGLSSRAARARAAELIEQFDLVEAGPRLAREYSGGMRRRLDLAASLVSQPRLLYLDEPTTGLDPRSRRDLWRTVRELADSGTTVLLTTQYMEEAEALADTVVVIDRGKVVASGTPAVLRSRIGARVLRVRITSVADLPKLRHAVAATGLSVSGFAGDDFRGDLDENALAVAVPDELDVTRAVQALAQAGLGITAIDTLVPSLDEVFLRLTEPAATARGGAQ